ncbi:MAG: hypothetical protein ACWA5A_12065 [Marinibacterium sp.]
MNILARFALISVLFAALPAYAQGPAFPVYGNYCGINHDAGSFSLPPVDPIDAACMRHDICTIQLGRFDCGCDIALMNELRYTPWPNPVVQDAARSIYEAIAIVPCADPMGMAYKAACLAQDLSTDFITGRDNPMEILRRLSQVGATGMSNAYMSRW